jgi:hypothetical protein
MNQISSLKQIKKGKFIQRPVQNLPNAVLDMVSSRTVRLQHYMWHHTRNKWLSLTEKERLELREMGWEPPRPALDSSGKKLVNNNSGEDFLFMHRKMIEMVNTVLEEENNEYGDHIEGWKSIPEPQNEFYPVPRKIEDIGFESYIKSEEYFYNTMKPLSEKFTNPVYLRTVTLGQLGSELEFDIHNQMHIRWSAFSQMREEVIPFFDFDKIDTSWDIKEYDSLNDFYSSQVNPIFYKLHGWIDDRVLDWQEANRISEIVWKGTWIGPNEFNHMSHNDANMRSMKGIIIKNIGVNSNLPINKTIILPTGNLSHNQKPGSTHIDHQARPDIKSNNSIKINETLNNLKASSNSTNHSSIGTNKVNEKSEKKEKTWKSVILDFIKNLEDLFSNS